MNAKNTMGSNGLHVEHDERFAEMFGCPDWRNTLKLEQNTGWLRTEHITPEQEIIAGMVEVLLGEEDIQPDNLPCINGQDALPCLSNKNGCLTKDSLAIRIKYFKRIASLADLRKLWYKGWLVGVDSQEAFKFVMERDTNVASKVNPHDDLMFDMNRGRERIRQVAAACLFQNYGRSSPFDVGTLEKMLDEIHGGVPERGEFDEYWVQDLQIYLRNHDGAFPPSYTSMMFANNMQMLNGGTMYGVGVGSGLQEIVGSKLGASEVVGVDPVEDAIVIANQNAQKNGCNNCTFKVGTMFSAAKGRKFDLISANVPQTPENPASSDGQIGINAGRDGTKFVEQVLTEAPTHMHRESVLLIDAASIANARRVLDIAQKRYKITKIASQKIPIPPYAMHRFPYLQQAGTTDYIYSMYQPNAPVYTHDTLLSLKLK